MTAGRLRRHLDAARDGARDARREVRRGARRGGAGARGSLELEFMPAYLEILERPPSRVGRFFGISIMALAALALAWSILGRIDVVASAPGKMIVDRRSQVVQAPEAGEVARIAVWDGQAVARGDVLIELNPTAAAADAARLRGQVAMAEVQEAQLRALRAEDPPAAFAPPPGADSALVAAARERLDGEWAGQRATRATFAAQRRENQARQAAAEAAIEDSRALLDTVQERYDNLERLAKSANFPRLQLLERKQELIEQSRDLARQVSDLAVLKVGAETLEAEAARQEAEWRRDVLVRLDDQRRALIDLRQDQVKAEEVARLKTIVAPVDGIVQQQAVNTIGGVVSAGQELMVIVPDRADLEAEVSILDRDVGFVRAGQRVEVKIDSFPFTRYGTIPGVVRQVSRESTRDEQLGLVYPARVTLDRLSVPADGEETPLAPGMGLVAEVRTGERRIIDYLLSPLQEYRSEALQER